MIKNIVNKINSKTSSLCLIDEPLKKHTTYGIGDNINVTIRKSRGQDIDAACGQLANKPS